MHNDLTDHELLDALAFEVDLNLHRHIGEADGWQPHDLVPWDDGHNFAFLGGTDWEPEQATLSEAAKLALTVGVLAADNLPAYHRELAAYLRIGTWFRWVGRWTAEENRHEILIRNYLMVTRAVDPVELERLRMGHMVAGFSRPPLRLLDVLAEATFDEAAGALRHRNTAALGENPVVTNICERIAADDELQKVFFANLIDAAFRLAPDQTMRAVIGRIDAYRPLTVPLPGGRDCAAALAEAGIYDHAETPALIFQPLLKRWNVFDRTDFGAAGEQARAQLAALV